MLLGLVLVSCTDTDGPPEDLVGTAAMGAAISGTVYAMDATGVEISKAINADGFFRFDVRGMTAPFIMKSVADNGTGPDLFSYAVGTDVTVNITPLTNLAMYIANGYADPAPLYNNWVSVFGSISAAAITDAQATVNANLSTQYTAFSLDPFTYDFIGTRFLANSTSIDALLDAMTVDLTAGISIAVVGVTMPLFDPVISTIGFDIGADSVATTGAYTLTMNVSVDAGVTTSSDLLLSINLPASSVPTPAGNTQIVQDIFSTIYGSMGTIVINSVVVTVTVDAVTLIETTVAVIDATITKPDNTVVNYIATYTYTPNP
ncbi:MAG: hypothetical protein ABUK13_07865 [Gammaproteobacteria bacterium]